MDALEYIIEVTVCSGLFLALYRWLISGKTGYRICRMYILTAMTASAVIPALDIPVYSPDTESPALVAALEVHMHNRAAGLPADEQLSEVEETGTGTSWQDGTIPAVIKILYISVSALMLLLMVYNTLRLYRLQRRCRMTRLQEYLLAEGPDIKSPFSFLDTIFIGTGSGYTEAELDMVIAHEASHIRHRHSCEKLVMAALRSALWTNPFFWMAEKDLAEVHEWEADMDVLSTGAGLTEYRTAILRQIFGHCPDMSCGLGNRITSKRFIMMTNTPHGRHAWLRPAAALPIFTAALLIFGCGARSQARLKAELLVSPAKDTAALAVPVHAEDSCIVIKVTENNGTTDISVDGQHCTLDELQGIIESKTSSEEDWTVQIVVSGNVTAGFITDIKEILRITTANRIRYGNLENMTEQTTEAHPTDVHPD